MKIAGTVRKVDDLGRVVIPREVRTKLDIKVGDRLEVFTREDKVIFRKHKPGCQFCDNAINLLEVGKIIICHACAEEIAKRVNRG